MDFRLNEAIEILERTPHTLTTFLHGLSGGWLDRSEGDGTWTVTEVMGHLVEAEKTNWLPRIESILQHKEPTLFPPFDRDAHLRDNAEKSLEKNLQAFQDLRRMNLSKLRSWIEPDVHLEMKGLHPAFGEIRMRELLSTWVVHDFTHIAQMVRVMANRYRDDVGPWAEYLGILNRH